MTHGNRGNRQTRDHDWPPRRQLVELYKGPSLVRETQHIGPDPVVEDVRPKAVQNLCMGMNDHVVLSLFVDVVQEQWQRQDVIGVAVSEEEVRDSSLLLRSTVQADAAGVDGDGAVDQESRQVLACRLFGRGRQDLHSHCRSPSGTLADTCGSRSSSANT